MGKAVVIGGGITGILTARALLLDGWQVTVLEAEHIGAGSSSRTAAGIRQQFSTPGTVQGMRYCVDFYKRFQAEVADGTSPIVQNGYLFLHNDPDKLVTAREQVAMQQAAGLVDVELLEGAALRERFPWVSPDLLGGSWCPSDGFLLPHLVYMEGARRVRELGGEILGHSKVIGADVEGGRIVGVKTKDRTVQGDMFLDCTNAWTHRLAKALGASPLPVAPLKRYIWFLARGGSMTAETLGSMPLTIAPSGVYCRPENEDTLLMGKKGDVVPEWDFSYEDQDRIDGDFDHRSGLDAVPVQRWLDLSEAIPGVEEFDGLTATTSGYYATTPDHNPFLGFDPQRSNLIRMVGHSGHGAMLGPFTAAVGAALAKSGKDLSDIVLMGNTLPLEAFAIGRSYDQVEAMVI